MISNYKNFIATYSNVFPEGYCQHLIKQFDIMENSGAGYNRIMSDKSLAHVKNDHQISLSLSGHNVEQFNGESVVSVFFDGLQKCYEEYSQKFSVLREGSIRSTAMKMQRTGPGGGYHIWHAEQNNGAQASRVLVYMLYLNTFEPEQAGETEFLYQQERYSPVENTMVLWPAAYTHAHRGNTVFGNNSKYIVTGWFYFD